ETERLVRAGLRVLVASAEAFGAGGDPFHRAIVATRQWPVARDVQATFESLAQESMLWQSHRLLQDPLCYRCGLWLLATLEEARRHLCVVVERWLNGYGSNPCVLVDDGTIRSCGNFESVDLALALDLVRLAVVPLAQASAERISKLVNRHWSGLPTGLARTSDEPDPGLAILELAAHAASTELRVAATPFVTQPVSGAVAEGIEDRGSFALAAARALRQQLALAWQVLAIETTVSVAALRLRRPPRLAASTQELVGALEPVLAAWRGSRPVHELVTAAQAILMQRDRLEQPVESDSPRHPAEDDEEDEP
ncbi:MAG: aromatic amino acid lyase, partial [Dehalococcoidia bacterium]|nr:aromatic amino acid lyase [Dehalococcoidia bacterium]